MVAMTAMAAMIIPPATATEDTQTGTPLPASGDEVVTGTGTPPPPSSDEVITTVMSTLNI